MARFFAVAKTQAIFSSRLTQVLVAMESQMGVFGLIVFFILLIIFIFTFRSFAIFIGGAWRAKFNSKELVKFSFGLIAFVAIFSLAVHFNEELGTKKTCARNAPSCEKSVSN